MRSLHYLTLLAALSAPIGSLAQEAPAVSLELNKADTVGDSCRLTFVLKNGFEQDITKMVAETVLFSDTSEVLLLTLFDFGNLPAKRPRVRQFQVPQTSCNKLGMVLINGLDKCQIDDADSDNCSKALKLSNRTKIGFEG